MSTRHQVQIADAARGDVSAAADLIAEMLSGDIGAQMTAASEVGRCDDAEFWAHALEFAATGNWAGSTVPGSEPGTAANERARQFIDGEFERKDMPGSVAAAQEKALLESTRNRDQAIRKHAIHLLGARGHSEEGMGALQKSLNDPAADVRQAANAVLGVTTDENTIKDLAHQLAEADYSTRHHARLQLARIGEPALPALAEMLQSSEDRTRWEAAKAVQGIGTARTAPVLAATLQDGNVGVRNVAVDGLVALGESAVRPVLKMLISHSGEAAATSGARHVLTQLVSKGIYADALEELLHALSVSAATATVAPVAAREALVKLGMAGQGAHR